MAIRSVKNQYRGINAHLHSFWQARGTWNRFHNGYITHLTETLAAQLRPMGYVADMEESLQIRRLGEDFPRRPRSNPMIYDPDTRRAVQSLPMRRADGLSVAELIEEEDRGYPYFAITVYPIRSDMELGEPVAWIELLSPTNKGHSDDAAAYIGKRRALLDSGMVFVELDFLHETPPTFSRLADYSTKEAEAHPYRIVILDPRPSLKRGPAEVEEFDVDTPIPQVVIPLNADDRLEFDFGVPYNEVFERGFHGDRFSYDEFPLHFERYSAADQTRIARRMLAVLEATRQKANLEQGGFEVKEVSLEAATAAIEAMKMGE